MIVGISIHLDHDEACTRTVCTSKVDRALVAGDIEALDTASARLERSGTSGSEQKWEGSDLHDEYRGKVSVVNKKEGACPLFMPLESKLQGQCCSRIVSQNNKLGIIV